MNVVDYVTINKAANGYIVFYKESNNITIVEAEFVAFDIEEALDIVRDIFKYDEATVSMSHIVDEKVRKDS